jgi:hypothetical protein
MNRKKLTSASFEKMDFKLRSSSKASIGLTFGILALSYRPTAELTGMSE